MKRIVLEELDLELALKDRIAATVQSRITWALLLQESLNKEFNCIFFLFCYQVPLNTDFCEQPPLRQRTNFVLQY